MLVNQYVQLAPVYPLEPAGDRWLRGGVLRSVFYTADGAKVVTWSYDPERVTF